MEIDGEGSSLVDDFTDCQAISSGTGGDQALLMKEFLQSTFTNDSVIGVEEARIHLECHFENHFKPEFDQLDYMNSV